MSKNMIWGIIVILLGISILIKAIFKIDIPLTRIALGLFFIYLGAKFIVGKEFCEWSGAGTAKSGSAVFSNNRVQVSTDEKPRRNYSSVFGNTDLDFSKLVLDKEDIEVEINTVFGSAKVTVAQKTPLEVETSVVFGHAILPNDFQVAVGRQIYRSENAKNAAHLLKIKSNVVFGSFELIQKL